MEYEFEKECINQMARTTLRSHASAFSGESNLNQKYAAALRIGQGFTYSKYNTLMHFLNVTDAYWRNPDLNGIQVFGKDIRALLAISCEKIFFEDNHSGYYHYGPIEKGDFGRRGMDLQVSVPTGEVPPSVSKESRGNRNTIVLTDRVYEHKHLLNILEGLFSRKALFGRFKSDDAVLNLCLLSLQLDFGLCEQYAGLLNIPFLKSLKRGGQLDKKELQVRVTLCTPALLLALTTPSYHPLSVCAPLQVEVSNWISEFDKKNTSDSVTRLKVEMLLFEASYNFIVNKNFSLRSKTFELIQMLNGDPIYQQYASSSS